MGAAATSTVSRGFVIPKKHIHSLLEVLHKYAEESSASEPAAADADTKDADEAQEPPAKKAKRKVEDWELDELIELAEAAIAKADNEFPKAYEGPFLSEIVALMRVRDERAGKTVAFYYSGGREPDTSGEREIISDKMREYTLAQYGHEPEDYPPRSLCMGNKMTERILEGIPDDMGETLRKALHLKEAGIEVEDQWILISYVT